MKVSKIFSQKHVLGGLLGLVLLSLVSCGTYQSAYMYDDDGIYTSYENPQEGDVVVVEKSEFDKNYFSKQLDDLQQIGDDDVFTDIDEYYYEGELLEGGNNQPWEYTELVTVNLDFSNRGFYGYDYYWYAPYFNNYYPYYYSNFYNPWRYRYYNPYRYYGYSPFYSPYYYDYYGYGFGYYNGYYPHYGYSGYYGYSPYNRYYNSYDRYGKRTTYNTRTRRSSLNSDILNRSNSSLRSTRSSTASSSANSNNTSRRTSNNSANRSSNNRTYRSSGTSSRSSIQRGSSTIRRSSSSSSSRRRNMAYNYTPSSTRYEVNESNGNRVFRIPTRTSNYSSTKTKANAMPTKGTRKTYISPVRNSGNQRKVVRTSKPTTFKNTYRTSSSGSRYKSSGSSSSRSSSSYSRSSSSSTSSSLRSSSSASSSRSSSSSTRSSSGSSSRSRRN